MVKHDELYHIHNSTIHIKIYCNSDRARKLYRAPDKPHQDRLKKSLMETAVRRNDAWGHEVAGRLSGIIDLVAEEALYHLRCRSQFESPVTNYEVRLKLYSIYFLLYNHNRIIISIILLTPKKYKHSVVICPFY